LAFDVCFEDCGDIFLLFRRSTVAPAREGDGFLTTVTPIHRIPFRRLLRVSFVVTSRRHCIPRVYRIFIVLASFAFLLYGFWMGLGGIKWRRYQARGLRVVPQGKSCGISKDCLPWKRMGQFGHNKVAKCWWDHCDMLVLCFF